MNFKNIITVLLMLGIGIKLQAQDLTLKIHMRGVHESKITLQSISGGSIKTVAQHPGIKKGQTGILKISKDVLPGEFVLRFDYKQTESSSPYPSERRMIMNKQDLELWANPLFANNPDSTYFQKSETENSLMLRFARENIERKEKLSLLQNFLMGYDQPQSAFYQSGIDEFEKRRREYNNWLIAQTKQYANQFVSHSFLLQYIPKVEWKGTEQERTQSLIANYFEGIDFQDALLIHSSNLREWMDGYVNIYGTMATSIAIRDSLFTLAGRRAIEKAREGHPLVYGWMVDYFYNGYESFNMQAGIKMLEPYLGDPRCMTTKRIAIEKRLKGMETLIPGTIAPDFMIQDEMGKPVEFSKYKTASRYKLLLFWSADCQHCKDLVRDLHPWYEQTGQKKLDVFAISLDDTDAEIASWEKAKNKLPGWIHRKALSGINSPEANAYYVLSTPTMVLIDSRTNKIVSLPENLKQLEETLR